MTFGPKHYVPVLKVKQNEKKALGILPLPLQRRITPLLEIVERKDKTVDAHLTTAFKQLAASVHGYPACFLDAREMAADGPEAAEKVFQRASSAGMSFIPITGMSRTSDVAAALSHRTRGLALRLTREELESGNLGFRLIQFLAQRGLEPEGIDLILDLGPVENLVVPGIAALSMQFLAEVPEIPRWRTLTVSACAFPQGLGAVDRNSHDVQERAEWIAWRERLHGRRGTLARLPTFSDCGIQHPSGVEDYDPRIMPMSAAIRYTLDDAWLLVKGESTRNRRPGLQFPELATDLVYGHLSQHFDGAAHCSGCSGAKACADGRGGFNSAGSWRYLGTVHHITKVMEGLDSLPWP